MSYRNLVPMLNRLGIGRYPELTKLIECAIQEDNRPLLDEFVRFFNSIDSKLTDLEKRARMGYPFHP